MYCNEDFYDNTDIPFDDLVDRIVSSTVEYCIVDFGPEYDNEFDRDQLEMLIRKGIFDVLAWWEVM
jgi:hypothetical protein